MERHSNRLLTAHDPRYSGTLGWGQNAPPGPPPSTDHNQLNANDWKSMIDVIQGVDSSSNVSRHHRSSSICSAISTKGVNKSWIERTFEKRECIKFVPIFNDPSKCGCGRQLNVHPATSAIPPNFSITTLSSDIESDRKEEQWSISRHTMAEDTDAFGTIEFHGGPHPFKAQYARVAFDSDPADLMLLFDKVWHMRPPKLVITVHGGIDNFNLQPKLARAFQDGLMKAATTAGAWIMTSGVNAGVVRHLAAAFESNSNTRAPIVTIGIAPWGLLKKRDNFVGRNATVHYHTHALSPKGPLAVLNDRHSYFLFVDNGTVGRSGAEIVLRQRLEEHIAQKQKIEGSKRKVPVVCIVLEGGTCAIRSVLDYVTNIPPIPVVVCDGSGRAADLLAFAHRFVQDDGTLPEGVKPQLLSLVQKVFKYNKPKAEKALQELMLCVQIHDLMTVFRLGEDEQQDVDHAILTALLKGQNLSGPDQLALSLAWNRVDIAKSDIFVLGQEWTTNSLHAAMMDALINDRVDFVRLLLKNGVSMHKFLTFERLEELYNSDRAPPNTLHNIVGHVVKNIEGCDYHYTLPDIGLAMEKLLGSAYQSAYRTREFRAKYATYKLLRKHKSPMFSQNKHVRPRAKSLTDNADTLTRSTSRALRNHMNWRSAAKHESNRASPVPYSHIHDRDSMICVENGAETPWAEEPPSKKKEFAFPFNDLLLWAVLTKRHEMALCMWQHGEEAMAKALLACMLYQSMSEEAASDYLEIDLHNEFEKCAEEFGKLSVELLDQCYQQDEGAALQLLTYELKNWSCQTCLSLAVIARNKPFVAHPCCQKLICDLWNGGLRMRSQPDLKVLLGLLCPPTILFLEYKSHEELKMQPQTASEHAADSKDADSRVDDYSPFAADNCVFEGDNDDPHHRKASAVSKRSIKKLDIPRFVISSDEGDHTSLGGTELTESDLKAIEHNEPPILRQRSSIVAPQTHRSLHWKRKFYEFYMAPITTYWSWTLSYIIFICAFTSILLVDLPVSPSWIEWLLVAYVAAFTLERCRVLVMSEPCGFTQKLKTFFSRPTNILNTIAVFLFAIGFICRLIPEKRGSCGHVILVLSLVFWQLKTLEYLNVHKTFGPNIYIAALMLQSTMSLMVLLLVGMMIFGTVRQTILRPQHVEFNWLFVRNLFFIPYLMLYGELFKSDIDACAETGTNCVPGSWIPIVIMVMYLVIANILLLNLLIAVFNNIFSETNAISQQVWLLDRYVSVMEFESTPILPPPFTPIYHLYMLYKYLRIRYYSNHKSGVQQEAIKIFDFALKVFLNEKQEKKLNYFEEDCMDLLIRNKETIMNSTMDQKIRRTAERVEFLSLKLNDMMSCETSMRNEIREKDAQMDAMQQNQRDILALLTELSKKMNAPQTKMSPAAVSDKAIGTDDSLPPPPVLLVPGWSCNKRPSLTASISYGGNENSPSVSPDVPVKDESVSLSQSPKPRKFEIVVVENNYEEFDFDSDSENGHELESFPNRIDQIRPPLPTAFETGRSSCCSEQNCEIPVEKLTFPVSASCLTRALIEQVPLDHYPHKMSMPNLGAISHSGSFKQRRPRVHHDEYTSITDIIAIVETTDDDSPTVSTSISNEDHDFLPEYGTAANS